MSLMGVGPATLASWGPLETAALRCFMLLCRSNRFPCGKRSIERCPAYLEKVGDIQPAFALGDQLLGVFELLAA